MKALIILATALLVPVMMKFQAEVILTRSNPRTAVLVEKSLLEAGVADGEASVRALEATIVGSVESEEQSQEVEAQIRELPGISQVVNQLVVQAFFQFERRDGHLVAQGTVPAHWKSEVMSGQPEMEASALLTRDRLKIAGKSAVVWGLLIDQFFGFKGTQSLSLSGSTLTLAGEILPSEGKTLQPSLAGLGRGLTVESRLQERPSRYHLQGRPLQSLLEGEPLRSLQRQVTEQAVSFEEGQDALTPEGLARLQEMAQAMAQAPPQARFLLGAHPESEGDPLASGRAQRAQTILLQGGVKAAQLEVVPFEYVSQSPNQGGQVEILIR